MELVRSTPLELATLVWPIRPPQPSMLVVVKATYDLVPDSPAALAQTQAPPTGELFWDDDPEASVRYDSDFALAKPRGECLLTGVCRPAGGRAVDRTVGGFRVGPIEKRFAIYGPRRWVGSAAGRAPGPPEPFQEMPLRWERAFGGPGYDANPMGVGLAAGPDGTVGVPNLEPLDAPLTNREERPAPAGAFPWPRWWKVRAALAGTYDARWRRTRYPWLAEDFRFAYFQAAPEDQRIDGFWRGDEVVALEGLVAEHPELESRLPGLRPRAFVEWEPSGREEEEEGSFSEVALALDTITLDADTAQAFCVWRGVVELPGRELSPEGVRRMFLMHEAGSERASVAACRERLRACLVATEREAEEVRGEPPAPEEQESLRAVDSAPPELREMLDGAGEAPTEGRPDGEDRAAGLVAELEAQLADLGVDVEAMRAAAQDAAPPPSAEPKPEAIRALFERGGQQVPEEIEEVLAQMAATRGGGAEAERRPREPGEEPDPRQRVIEAHAAGRPLDGDFSGAQLAELDLRGLNATGAILADANLRGADLRDAVLDGASMPRADLLKADMRGVRISGADLTGAILEEADLSEAVLDRSRLDGASLEGARLFRASLRSTGAVAAVLEDADLSEAVCDEADLSDAQLGGARCVEASFVDARMYGADAREADFRHAVLESLRASHGARFDGADLRHVRAARARWRFSHLRDANLTMAVLEEADLTGADLRRARLGGCVLRRALLQEADLREARIIESDLFEANLQRADLAGADLRGSNLYAADLFAARLVSTRLEDANLERASLEGDSVERGSLEEP